MTTLDDLTRELYAADDEYAAADTTFTQSRSSKVWCAPLCEGYGHVPCPACDPMRRRMAANDRRLASEEAVLTHLRAQRQR